MDKAFSDAEILRVIPEATIILSPELKKLRRLPSLPLVILYTTAPNYGHWTLLHRPGRPTIEFFDSYGMKPDDQLAYISPAYRRESDQTKKELVRLLLGSLDENEAGLGMSYNEHEFQAPRRPDGRPVNTCGRWIILRYLSGVGGLSLEEFRRIAWRGSDPDEWAVAMTGG